MDKLSTKSLVEELQKREAVQSIWIPPYKKFTLKIGEQPFETEVKEGACHILIVWD